MSFAVNPKHREVLMPSSGRSSDPLLAKSYCRFIPGRGLAPHDGAAFLGLTGVEIDLADRKPRRIWRYDQLHADEPIRPNAIEVLLSSSAEPGHRCSCRERNSLRASAPARRIFRRAPVKDAGARSGWHFSDSSRR